ncbi:hypothetical protein AALB53_22910 [Lachnospiraceae bacterium 47-T17]
MDRIINIAFQAPVLQNLAEHGFILWLRVPAERFSPPAAVR